MRTGSGTAGIKRDIKEGKFINGVSGKTHQENTRG